ncbi:hypothetical protein V6N13_135896 [Hibiscus sabdariffa]|uniref:Uncharacterized protein n=2 Tax=Hibiscus sabdariffa TaxID=183260 RepID=A0ABR2A5Y6_9ROSI
MQEALTFQSRSHFIPSSAEVYSFTGCNVASCRSSWTVQSRSPVISSSTALVVAVAAPLAHFSAAMLAHAEAQQPSQRMQKHSSPVNACRGTAA